MSSEKNPILKVRSLKKVFKTGDSFLTVLDGLNLDVHRGETVAIIGRSGSGKSTLLNLIGGLDTPSQGSIIISGTHIEKASEEELSAFRNRSVGFIFQFHHLLSEFTITENIMMPYLVREYNFHTAYDRAQKLMKILDIYSRKDLKPNKLSGGESQRVAIARALINEPELILADEPTGNLDDHTAEIIKDLLFNIVKEFDHTMIIVTHNKSIVEAADTTSQLTFGILRTLPRV